MGSRLNYQSSAAAFERAGLALGLNMLGNFVIPVVKSVSVHDVH